MNVINYLAGILALLLVHCLSAQTEIDPFVSMTKEEIEERKELIDEGSKALSNMMVSQAMDDQMKRMVEIVMDQQIQYLEKPDTLRRIAIIARKYHQELIEAGFSKEEALEIVSRTCPKSLGYI